jgi:2-aminoadipate transaminase
MKTSFLSEIGRRTEEPPISWLMSLRLSHPRVISLAAGFTDQETLPHTETLALLEDIFHDIPRAKAALQYGSTQGDLELRDLTTRRIHTADAGKSAKKLPEVYSPGRMILSHGSQQSLYLVCEALCDPGDIVLVEDPTYFVFLAIAQSRGIDCRGIPLTSEGPDLASLEAKLEGLKRTGEIKRVKMLYLVSYFQNPSSITASLEKKAAAMKLVKKYERAAGHPIFVLEDAAYRELRFSGQDVPSLLTVPGAADRLIYSGTFSKPFASGIRVGFSLLPEPLLTTCLRLKGNHDFGTSHILQQILSRAISTGVYDKHLELLHDRYRAKAAVMGTALVEHMPASCQWPEPHGGLYFWVSLPETTQAGRTSPFFKAALKADVFYVPGELCYADDPTREKPHHEMRVSFGGASIGDIAEGVKRLGAVAKKMCR